MSESFLPIIHAIRDAGSDATSLRNAVHEAHHALDAGVPKGDWERLVISRAVKRMGRAKAASSEIYARVVERRICERFDVEIRPLEITIGTSVMEAAKYGEAFMSWDQAMDLAKDAMHNPSTERYIARIIALGYGASLRIRKRA